MDMAPAPPTAPGFQEHSTGALFHDVTPASVRFYT